MPRKVDESRRLQKRAEQMIPGGVNSPVRAFRAVGGDPPFIVRGQSSHLWDADGNKYSNTVNGEGSLWMEEFRGEVTPTMVFDGRPVHDHFKKIDDNAVMGVMDGQNALDNGRHAYFYLERV